MVDIDRIPDAFIRQLRDALVISLNDESTAARKLDVFYFHLEIVSRKADKCATVMRKLSRNKGEINRHLH